MLPPKDPVKKLQHKMSPWLAQDQKTAAKAKKLAGPGTSVTMSPGNKKYGPVFHYGTKGRKKIPYQRGSLTS